MAKYDIDDDPSLAMTTQAKALAEQRQLDAILDKIAEEEKRRADAGDQIRKLWRVVERKGFDVADARRQLVRRYLA